MVMGIVGVICLLLGAVLLAVSALESNNDTKSTASFMLIVGVVFSGTALLDYWVYKPQNIRINNNLSHAEENMPYDEEEIERIRNIISDYIKSRDIEFRKFIFSRIRTDNLDLLITLYDDADNLSIDTYLKNRAKYQLYKDDYQFQEDYYGHDRNNYVKFICNAPHLASDF